MLLNSSITNLEKEEHLSVERLQKLNNLSFKFNSEPNKVIDTRPTASFLDLMNWVEKHFSHHLSDGAGVNKFIHNRILIDGQFSQFCEERNIEIKTLYKDSVISWKTENNAEKFFVQGIFLIKGKNFEFIHSALFHKGNNNDDEISFFNLVAEKSYEPYLNIRNEFDAWIVERDRSNSHIRIIDGEDIPYTKDNSWEDLFLPNEMKNEIKQLVENFLNNKDFYVKNKIPWKRGMLFFGAAGNGKSSLIKTIISNYNFKPVSIASGANDDAMREAFSYAEEQSPSLLYFEDLDSMIDQTINASSFLNLMDGISAKNGLFIIATANDISKLKANITDRPSRFDRKFEIPLPNAYMSSLYLKKWFGNLISLKKIKELANLAVKYKFSYAYLKELYISSMFEALANGRKTPTENDISNSIGKLLKDKNLLKFGKSINTEKYFSK